MAYAINEAFLSRLERLQTVLKNNCAGNFGGNHKSRLFGSSCEFADHRDYQPGDDVTKIDWNIYGRTEILSLKRYLDERQLHTRIYIDISRSMDFEEGRKSALALEIAATVAYLSVCELDRVSIYTVQESHVEEIISGMAGREQFFRQIGRLNDITFGGDCMISEGLLPTKVGYGDGLTVIISDFLTDHDYETAIDLLVDKKRDLLCIQTLTTAEINPQIRGKNHLFDAEDSSRHYRKKIDRDVIAAYRKAVKYVEDRLRNYCNARGASYLLATDQKPVDQLFFEQMTEVGVLK